MSSVNDGLSKLQNQCLYHFIYIYIYILRKNITQATCLELNVHRTALRQTRQKPLAWKRDSRGSCNYHPHLLLINYESLFLTKDIYANTWYKHIALPFAVSVFIQLLVRVLEIDGPTVVVCWVDLINCI